MNIWGNSGYFKKKLKFFKRLPILILGGVDAKD